MPVTVRDELQMGCLSKARVVAGEKGLDWEVYWITVGEVPDLPEWGYGLSLAASSTGLIGASQVIGRVVVTFVEGRLPRDAVTAGIFALQAVALVVLIQSRSPLGVLLFVLPFGAASGAVTLARATAVAEFYGPDHYGSIGGVVGMFVTGARTLAPVGAGAMSAALGGYAPVLWTLTLGSALAAVAMFMAQRLVPPLRSEVDMKGETLTARARPVE